MTTGIGQAGWHTDYAATGTGRTNARAAVVDAGGGARDVADISEQAREFFAMANQALGQVSEGGYVAGQSTYGKMAGLGNLGLKKYLGLNGRYGDTSLAAMTANRKSMSRKIDSLVKSAGVKLGKDEKFTLSVDARNNIRVAGLKDSKKAQAIEDALNKDRKLARDLRSHVANGKITEAAQKQQAYVAQMQKMGMDPAALGDVEDMFTNRSLRTYVIDEYLQANAGLSLSDLQYEKLEDGSVSLVGVPEELRSLFDQDRDLAATVANMLENGETASDFKVSFEFANGALSDSTSDAAARDKIEGVKAFMMGAFDENGNKQPGIIDKMRERLEAQGVDPDDPQYKKLMSMLSRGFSIRVGQNGEYDIVGAEDMDDRMVNLLKTVVEDSLSAWAEDPSGNASGTEKRVGNFADVAEAFIEQHRFEHGDVDEFEHMVEINFAGGRSDVKVVSPKADEAQDAKNQGVAEELGKKLKGVLEENGIDVGPGIEVEIDDKGKVTVLGDPYDPAVREAQRVLDQFVRETKSLFGAEGLKDKADDDETAAKRREVRGGTTSVYERENRKKFIQDRLDEAAPHLPDGEDAGTVANARAQQLYLGWMANAPKYESGTRYASAVGVVSAVARPRFGDGANPHVGNTLAMNETAYGDDAGGLYRRLVDGMGQFHDEHRKAKYRFTIQ